MKEHHLEEEKKFLYGFSLGGLTVAKAVIDRPDYFEGVIMALPYLDSHESLGINGFKRFIISVAAFCAGDRHIPARNDPEA